MGFIDKIKLRKKQRLLNDRSVLVNRTSQIHHQVLRVCITYYCNRDCSFCYSQGLEEEFKEHMSLADFEFLCHWAKSQGWRSLRLLGGEPTVHPEFKSILGISRKQGLTLSTSTNGLYNPGLNAFFDKALIESINFSYPQDQLNPDELRVFQNNLKTVISMGIPVVLSGVIYPDRQDWRLVIDLAKEFRSSVVTRFSMVLPGHSKHFDLEEFKNYTRGLAKQIMDIARYAYKNYVVFYFYRPLLLCMFNKDEIKFLNSISQFLFDTFCSCSCIDGTMVTINPDLSCFPCPSLSLKGIKVTPQMDRETIYRYFKKLLNELSITTIMDSCQECEYFINYKRYIKNEPLNIDKESLCHGGCFQYRCFDKI